MRPVFIELLCCPSCGGDLALSERIGPATDDDGHIIDGSLNCQTCSARFPVERGVPRLLPDDKNRSAVRDNTAARFGYEWNKFSSFDAVEEEKGMATWFSPRRLDDLAGLTVFDAGCGMGRHATIAAGHGVRRLVGIDLGTAVEAAFKNTRHLESVCIVQGDIYHPPLRSHAFDAGYSLGVLHHLPDPERGFAALAKKIKPGGWFQVWVYGREGNGLLLYVLNPVRAVTSKMPLFAVKALAALVAAPFAIAAKTVYRIPGLGKRLPYAPYMSWLSSETFRKIHLIVFDQLIAPVAHYMRRSEVLQMVPPSGWKVEGIEHSRGMSWGIAAVRDEQPALAQSAALAPQRA